MKWLSTERPSDPSQITEIDLSNRNLQKLPEWIIECTKLKKFNCDSNNFSHTGTAGLPVLPTSLQELSCDSNNLYCARRATGISPLPPSLKALFCKKSNISSGKAAELPALPSSLEILFCSDNNLSELPALPSSLEILFCPDNNLSKLPTLPSSLRELYCSNNNLLELPALSDSLQILNCSNNKLSQIPLQLLECKQLTNVYYEGNPIETMHPSVARFLDQLNNPESKTDGFFKRFINWCRLMDWK